MNNRYDEDRYEEDEVSPYSRDMVLLLCCIGFLGFAGIHRMYVGRTMSGILWFLTGGIFGLGTIYDLIKIFNNTFEDSEERTVLPKR